LRTIQHGQHLARFHLQSFFGVNLLHQAGYFCRDSSTTAGSHVSAGIQQGGGTSVIGCAGGRNFHYRRTGAQSDQRCKAKHQQDHRNDNQGHAAFVALCFPRAIVNA